MNLFHKIGLAVAASAALFAACSSDDDPFFARENDYLTFDCNEQTVEQSLQCDGAWSIDYDGNDDWIAVTPDSGVGNGELDFITVGVAYNRGGERTGTIYIDFAGHAYPIHITQGACDFAYGALSSAGTLVRGVESDFTLILAYANANGDESVALSCRMTGASEGLVAADCTFDKFQKGSGTITMPVTGVPAQTGEVFFELLVDGESKGTVKSTVVADPSSIVGGFPVWWDFSSESKPTLMADPHNYSWGAGSQYPCEDSVPSTDHKYLDWSDRGGYLTVVCSTASGWGYGEGHCYMKGLQKDDYWLMAFPVKNLKEGTRIAFEAAVGCSGSGARYYALLACRGVHAVEAGIGHRGTGDAHVHFGGSRLLEHRDDAPRGRAAHDRVVDQHHALAPDNRTHGRKFHPHALLAQLLRGLDKGAADILVLDNSHFIRQSARLGVTHRGAEARIGHADHDVRLGGSLLPEQAS